MHRSIFVSLLAITAPVFAADDVAATLGEAQSAWLRGAENELSQLAAANGATPTAESAYANAFIQFRLLQSAVARKNDAATTKAGEACIASAGKSAEMTKTGALAAEARAIQSSCYGYLAGMGGTFAAIRNGRASGKSMERALALDARNARVILVDAFGLYFRPRIAGGDKVKACARFRESAAAFDRPAPQTPGNWGAAEARFWVGRCLLDAGDATSARREFEAALKLAPEFAAAQRALRPKS